MYKELKRDVIAAVFDCRANFMLANKTLQTLDDVEEMEIGRASCRERV